MIKLVFLGVWQGVAVDPCKVSPQAIYALPFYTLREGHPLKRPNSCFRGGPLGGWLACGRFLPF
jgi:hypothetical protein